MNSNLNDSNAFRTKNKRVGSYIPTKLYDLLVEYCDKYGVTITDVIRVSLSEFLRKDIE